MPETVQTPAEKLTARMEESKLLSPQFLIEMALYKGKLDSYKSAGFSHFHKCDVERQATFITLGLFSLAVLICFLYTEGRTLNNSMYVLNGAIWFNISYDFFRRRRRKKRLDKLLKELEECGANISQELQKFNEKVNSWSHSE
jgi:uncharacterized protein YlaN (UPF0358 family)